MSDSARRDALKKLSKRGRVRESAGFKRSKRKDDDDSGSFLDSIRKALRPSFVSKFDKNRKKNRQFKQKKD